MKEIVRVVTSQITQINTFDDSIADEVIERELSERQKKELSESMKRALNADDVNVQVQLFVREIDE